MLEMLKNVNEKDPCVFDINKTLKSSSFFFVDEKKIPRKN